MLSLRTGESAMEKKCNQEQLGLGGVLILHEDAEITIMYQILGRAI